ncbi:Protein of unknown function [Devosia enhydra]|uniref:DUF3168 domain-containing protein n=1 Tax=Devosia enhydra TaxID=665118 RepID=A0A1K2I0F9_9HYPH|nr:DUF3168 domain-containing protein [Devosia enhydra]SFZ85877.1 Protein of unknown function [Devosia enhydra]
MTHPILALQGALRAAFADDAVLVALIGADGVFDAPPRGREPPYVTIFRHDIAPRDGDLAPGHTHRLVLQAWAAGPSRKEALAIVDRLVAVALDAPLAPDGLAVTLRRHERTETAIDARTGRARATLTLGLFTEPSA